MNYFILAKIGNVNMKKTFQKTLIAAAAGVALMSAVGTASANSLLFPYFTTVAGATSIVSLSTNNTAAAAGERIHYVYNYGTACTHFDGNGKMTSNDLLQHSIGSPTSTPVAGFGKVTTDTSTPFYFPLQDKGFLVVSTKTTSGADISGDMVVVDPSTGLVTSYSGISNNQVNTVAAANEGNFGNIVDNKFNLSFYPTSLVSTSWYAVVAGDMSGAIAANTDWVGEASLANGGLVYDNDEQPFSGAMAKALKCANSVVASDLMNSAQIASVGPKGGLIHATSTPDVATSATGLVMTKLQVLTTGSKLAFAHREATAPF